MREKAVFGGITNDVALLLGFICLIVLTACGGSSHPSTPPTPISVTVSPGTATLSVNSTQVFSATVAGSSNQNVIWTVVESGGGTITASGMYKAPLRADTYHVVATSQADSSKSATASVAVTAPAPNFTSTAPTVALTGTAYSYTVGATDPAGTAVTFKLTSAPEGASLNNNTVTWSPTAAHMSGPNNFSVTATTAAGGKQTQSWTVTVSAAQPIFNSTAPTTAQQNRLYSYDVNATDPDGTVLTLSLTSGPTGAILTGNSLAWTPTAVQSRVANAFTVTATSTTGAKNTQSWTVTPTGTVSGSYIANFWTANGKTTRPIYGFGVSALVPQDDGSLQRLSGIVNEDSTFTIENVPGGYYWLAFAPGESAEMYWTNSSAFDRGADFIGRYQVSSASQVRTFALNFTFPATDAWAARHVLWFGSPNASPSSWFTPANQPTIGATSFTSSEIKNVVPIDAAQGDVSYALQYEPVTGLTGGINNAAALRTDLPLTTFSTSAGTSTVTGILARTGDSSSVDINVQGSAWDSMFTNNIGPVPGKPIGFSSYVYVQPFTSDNLAASWGGPLIEQWPPVGGPNSETQAVRIGPYTGNRLYLAWALSEGDAITTDLDAGSLIYSDPFPSTWMRVFAAQQQWHVSIPINGSDVTFLLSEGYSGRSFPSATAPIVPAISPARDLRLNGASFTTGTSAPSGSTLSWSPPASGNVTGYHIELIEIAGTKQNVVADLYSPVTSLPLPSTLLTLGKTYVFLVEAIANPGGDMMCNPWHAAYPIAFSQVVSGPVTIQ